MGRCQEKWDRLPRKTTFASATPTEALAVERPTSLAALPALGDHLIELDRLSWAGYFVPQITPPGLPQGSDHRLGDERSNHCN